MSFIHTQVDTGLGFTCDATIVRLVRMFNDIRGIRSTCSCECDRDNLINIEFVAEPDVLPEFVKHLLGNKYSVILRLYGYGEGGSWSGMIQLGPMSYLPQIEEDFSCIAGEIK